MWILQFLCSNTTVRVKLSPPDGSEMMKTKWVFSKWAYWWWGGTDRILTTFSLGLFLNAVLFWNTFWILTIFYDVLPLFYEELLVDIKVCSIFQTAQSNLQEWIFKQWSEEKVDKVWFLKQTNKQKDQPRLLQSRLFLCIQFHVLLVYSLINDCLQKPQTVHH